MAKKLSDDELRAITDSEMRQAVGFWSGKLAAQRQKAMTYYLGLAKNDLTPPEVEGRSSVVSPDVRNTIESMLPQLMVKFAGSENVVEFTAKKPGDEPKAEQATDYINYIYHVKNDGERISYNWMKDALLSKNGIIKVWWDTRGEETREEYIGLDQVELSEIMDDDDLEVTEQKSYPDEDDEKQRQKALEQLSGQLKQAGISAKQDPQAAQAVQQIQAQIQQIKAQPPKVLYDVSVKRTMDEGRVCVENVPPEEFLISRKAKDIKSAGFVGHRVARTLSELKSQGYKNLDNISGDDQATALNMERIERLSWDDELAYLNVDNNNTQDESQRIVWVTECYLRVDADGDGIAELRKIVRAGNQILENEIVDCAPFVSICPIPMPHKFFGMSVADLAMEAQKIRTSILRGQLDNMYLAINGRHFAVDGQVNLDDLLTSRPGGVVRVKQPGAVGRLDQGLGDPGGSAQMMEYMHGFLEDSTGWSRNSAGTDTNALNSQTTATQATIVTNKADMRLDLIARNFATGFVELYRMMLKLTAQYSDKDDVIKLRGGWVPVNPREWRDGFDMQINVGLGTGNKDQQVAHMMAILGQQQFGLQIGTAKPENVYQAQKELTKFMGYRSGEKFFTDPAQSQPQQPQPNPDQIKAQSAMQLKQMELQHDGQKFQSDMQLKQAAQQQAHDARMAEIKAQYDLQMSNDQRDAQREQMKAQYDAQKAATEQENARVIADLNAQVTKYKADLDSQTKLTIAGMSQSQAPIVDTTQQDSALTALMEHLAAPTEIVRDKSGRAIGTRKVVQQ